MNTDRAHLGVQGMIRDAQGPVSARAASRVPIDYTNIEVSAPAMACLWGGLTGKLWPPFDAARIKKIAEQIAKDAVIPWSWAEDVIPGLGLPWEFGRCNILNDIGVPFATTFFRPTKKHDTTFGCDGYQAADFTSGIVQLERLGFAVDPTPFVEAALPLLRNKALLTWHELNVFWFKERRHRAQPITVRLEGKTHWGFESLKLPTGYKVTFDRFDGEIRSMQITPPRYRKPRMVA